MLINPMQEHGVLHNLYCIMHKNESIEVFYFFPLHEIEDWLIYLYALYKDLFGFYLMFMQIMSLFFMRWVLSLMHNKKHSIHDFW